MRRFVFLILLVYIDYTGCGQFAKPSATAAKAVVEAKLAELTRKHKVRPDFAAWTLQTFEKTNGVDGTAASGTRSYTVEWHATMVCTEPGTASPGLADFVGPGTTVEGEQTNFYGFGPRYSPGAIITVSGRTSFVKTEKGWRSPDGGIY